MKLQYKLGIMALGLIAFTSCEKNDPFADHLEIGQRVPTCYWEVGSTACKAGEYFSFKGQYYTEDGHTPSHSEVWYSVVRTDGGEATAQIAGPSFSYTKPLLVEEVVLASQSIASFPHSLAIWDGYEYILNDSVQVSANHAPALWNTPKNWETEKNNFDNYFPATFASDFEKEADSLIVTNGNYGALRYLYINRIFDTKLFDSLTGFNTTQEIESNKLYNPEDPQSIASIKSQLWYDYDNPKKSGTKPKVTGYYFPTIVDGVTKYNEVETNEVYEDGIGGYILSSDSTTRAYPVYESAPWVFSRLDNDKGAVVSTVREKYISAFSEALVKPITFEEWIYNSSDKKYIISFNRKCTLEATFKVFDTEGNVGVAHTSYKIAIN